jgi:hypothetical protein
VVSLEDRRSATARLTPQRATVLTATGSNGVAYELTVPAAAVLAETSITIIPIGSLRSSSADFVGGIQMEPEGLRFLAKATLRITLPGGASTDGLVGFGYQRDGSGFHFVPAVSSGSSVLLPVTHFSGAGAAAAQACSTAPAAGLSAEAIARQIVACVLNTAVREGRDLTELTAEEITIIEAALHTWFTAGPLANLNAALACLRDAACTGGESLLLAGANELITWEATVQALGERFERLLAEDAAAGWAAVDNVLRAAHARRDDQCVAEVSRQAKKVLDREVLDLEGLDDLLGRDENDTVLTDVCGRFLTTVADRIELDPSQLELNGGASGTVLARVTSVAGTPVHDTDLVRYLEWTTANAGIATVAGDGGTATVSAAERGQTVVSATMDDAEGRAAVIVAVEPEILPPCKHREVHPIRPELIACHNEDEVFVMDLAVDTFAVYAQHDWDDDVLHWSPDGTRILLRDDGRWLYVVTIPGDELGVVAQIPCCENYLYEWVDNSTVRFRSDSTHAWLYASTDSPRRRSLRGSVDRFVLPPAGVEGVRIIVSGSGASWSTVPDGDGAYVFWDLPAGVYQVTCEFCAPLWNPAEGLDASPVGRGNWNPAGAVHPAVTVTDRSEARADFVDLRMDRSEDHLSQLVGRLGCGACVVDLGPGPATITGFAADEGHAAGVAELGVFIAPLHDFGEGPQPGMPLAWAGIYGDHLPELWPPFGVSGSFELTLARHAIESPTDAYLWVFARDRYGNEYSRPVVSLRLVNSCRGPGERPAYCD